MRPQWTQSRPQIGVLSETVIVIRNEPGERNDHGRFVEGAEIRTTVSAVSNPPTGEDEGAMRILGEEGMRIENIRVFHFYLSDTESLSPGSDANSGNRLLYDGNVYQVHSLANWGQGLAVVYAIKEDL